MWDCRASACYYYRHRRVNGKPVREYIGKGEDAEQAASVDDLLQALKQTKRETKREQESKINAILTDLQRFMATAETLASATLVLAGFYRFGRGEWRERNVQTNPKPTFSLKRSN